MDKIYNQHPEVVKNLSNFIRKIPEIIPNRKKNWYREKNFQLSDVHAKSNDVFPQCFAGVKLLASRDLDQVGIFQKYNYGYASKRGNSSVSNEYDNRCRYMTTSADLHTASVTFKYDLPEKFKLKSNIEVEQMKTAHYDCTINYAAAKSYWSLSAASQNVNIEKLRITTRIHEIISPLFSYGCELTIKPSISRPLDIVSVSGSYKKKGYIISTTISNKGCEISLWKRITSCIEVAAICKEDWSKHQSNISAAFRHDLAHGGTFKAFFDSSKRAGFTMEMDVELKYMGQKQGEEYPVLRFVGSTMMNGNKNTHFGFGVFAYL